MSQRSIVARAADVGFGHIKASDGRDAKTSNILTITLPSQSPAAQHPLQKTPGVMTQRDTVIVPVGERRFEVGKQINLALHGNHETEVLDENFALSDAYTARLYGAFNYMKPNLPDNIIDVLVLGLPLNTYSKHQEALEKKFTGTHIINERGTTIEVKHCHVYPQPMGSYMSYMASRQDKKNSHPLALLIDPGYGTLDWFTCQGMSPNEARCGGIQRGMGAVLRAIAEDMMRKHGFEGSLAEMVRSIDTSLSTGTPFKRYGKEYDLKPHFSAGETVINEALQAVKNSVGLGADIDVIILTGGGAPFYQSAVQAIFPKNEVVVLENPAQANVRGFHLIAEMLGKSLGQVMRTAETA